MPTARDLAREDLTRRIVDAGRRQLVQVGAGALSLRAVARELGLASSAVYRYVETRDDLLTRLIIEAYLDLGRAGEAALGPVPTDDAGEVRRWRAVCTALRQWALGHPHEFTLVYGTPVPGYAAPTVTIEAAARSAAALGTVLRDALQRSRPDADDVGPLVAPALHADLDALARNPIFGLGAVLDPLVDDDERARVLTLVARGTAAWQQLAGSVVLELSGHLENVITDREAWFGELCDSWGRGVLPRAYRNSTRPA